MTKGKCQQVNTITFIWPRIRLAERVGINPWLVFIEYLVCAMVQDRVLWRLHFYHGDLIRLVLEKLTHCPQTQKYL